MNPVMIKIGVVEIRWYSVLILLAVLSVWFFTQKEASRFKVRKDFIFNLFFWGLIFGIIGARLYYVLFNLDIYLKDPLEIFKIWNGGLAIHGGLIAGLITVIVYTKKYKVRTIRIIDFISVSLLIGQAIGRWGNFFNMEAYGQITSVGRLKSLLVPNFIIEGMYIDGSPHIPTFYFESLACLVAFIIIILIRRGKYIKVGMPTAFYLVSYGLIRFFIEIQRMDALKIGGFKVAQIVSIIMFIVGLGMIMYLTKKGKFEDLYNDLENIEDIRY